MREVITQSQGPRAATVTRNAPAIQSLPAAAVRLREAASIAVVYANYGAQRLGRLGIAGVALMLFSMVTFFSGNVRLHQQLEYESQSLAAIRESGQENSAEPVARTPAQQASRFVHSLPTRNEIPNIIASVAAVAAASGIELVQGSYEYVPTDNDSLGRYRMSIPVTGSYPKIREFVENTLATVPAVSLDGLRVERDSVSEQVIRADLRFSVLLGEQK